MRVPHVRRPGQQPAGIEVEVLLGVGADLAGAGEQQRDVADGGEHPGDEPAPGGRRRRSVVRGGAGCGRRHGTATRRRPGAAQRLRGEGLERPSRRDLPGRSSPACRHRARAQRGPAGRFPDHPVEVRHQVVGSEQAAARRGTTASRWPAMSVTTAGVPHAAGLGDRHAPALPGRRAGQDPGPPVEIDELGVGQMAGQAEAMTPASGRCDLRLERGPLVALADDDGLQGRVTPCAVDQRVDRAGRSA